MPTASALTDEQVADTAKRFSEFLEKHGISARQAARGCDYSEATISEWQAGKYRGNGSVIAQAVENWMEREGRRRAASQPKGFISTQIAEHIRTVAYTADKRTMMAAVVAPSGCGKTFVIKALAEAMAGIYIYCVDGMRPPALYRALAEALGWKRSVWGTREDLRRFIVAKLAGTGRPIFLDEAHLLGKHVGCVRAIHDEARVAIIMAGTSEILELVNDRAHGRGQFSSRCIRYDAVDTLFDAENPDGNRSGRYLFSVKEVKAFFDMKGIRLADNDALMLLWALACLPNYGTLRLAETAAATAMDLVGDADSITRRDILNALRLLMATEFKHLERLAGRHMEHAKTATKTAAVAG